jgi:hypothetical protein
MMGLGLDEIISKIKEKANLSDEEIKLKISEKRDKLSGFVSEEGAAHILANELGIDLMENIRKHGLKIMKLKPGMRVGVTGKVIKSYEVRTFNRNGKEGKVGSFLIGDETGLIRIVLWDVNHIAKMESGEIKPDVVIKIENGNVRENNGYKEMHLGNYSDMVLNPEGVTIDAVKKENVGQSFDSGEIKISKLSDVNAGENASVYGTIVQVFDPRSYIGCTECGKKVVDKCESHPGALPKKIPILNFFVDDGYSGMRGVAFREQVSSVLGITDKEVIGLLDNPDKFEEIKNKVLGSQMLISGRVNSNEMYNRNEFMVRNVHEMEAKEILAKFLN